MKTHIEDFITTHLPNNFIANDAELTIMNLWNLFVNFNGDQPKIVKDSFYKIADGEVFFYDL